MSQNIAIIDYGSGNLRSVAKACVYAADQLGKDYAVTVTDDPRVIAAADRVVLPGVGAFGDCRRGLDEHLGLNDALRQFAHMDKKPFLGICVGMQLLADAGHEHGVHQGLGWISGDVKQLPQELCSEKGLKIPHMGWNNLNLSAAGQKHPVFAGIPEGTQVYFVHSYAFHPTEPADVLATTDYGMDITAAIGRDNIVGTQFHPEKSQAVGLKVISNFLQWTPEL